MISKYDARLLKYSAVSAAFLFIQEDLKAQAFYYEDVSPDFDLVAAPSSTVEEFIDLNFDGVDDFRLFAFQTSSGYGSSGALEIALEPLNGNEVAGQFLTATCYSFGTVYQSNDMLAPVDESAPITSALDWTADKRAIIDMTWFSGYGYCTSFWNVVPTLSEKYLPVRFNGDTGWNYGWIRVKGSVAVNRVSILDHALNAIPDLPLAAGDGVTAPCDTPNGLNAIVSSGGVANLSWVPVATATKYQVTGTKVGTAANYAKISNSPSLMTPVLSPGIFEWQVRARCADGGVSAPSTVNSFAVPEARLSNDSDFDFTAFANDGTVVIDVEISEPVLVNILLTDIGGKNVLVKQLRFREGRQNFTIETADLSAGVYILTMQTSESVRTAKLVIR